MWTAVVGGLIHRAATRISTASDQRSATPRRNRRTKDRRKPFRRGILECMVGLSVTFQNNPCVGLPHRVIVRARHRLGSRPKKQHDRKSRQFLQIPVVLLEGERPRPETGSVPYDCLPSPQG